jgi:hypothetical protein
MYPTLSYRRILVFPLLHDMSETRKTDLLARPCQPLHHDNSTASYDVEPAPGNEAESSSQARCYPPASYLVVSLLR